MSDSLIKQSILHPGVKVGKSSSLERVIVMENTEIPEGTQIRIGIDEEPLVIDQESLAETLALNSSQLEKKNA